MPKEWLVKSILRAFGITTILFFAFPVHAGVFSAATVDTAATTLRTALHDTVTTAHENALLLFAAFTSIHTPFDAAADTLFVTPPALDTLALAVNDLKDRTPATPTLPKRPYVLFDSAATVASIRTTADTVAASVASLFTFELPKIALATPSLAFNLDGLFTRLTTPVTTVIDSLGTTFAPLFTPDPLMLALPHPAARATTTPPSKTEDTLPPSIVTTPVRIITQTDPSLATRVTTLEALVSNLSALTTALAQRPTADLSAIERLNALQAMHAVASVANNGQSSFSSLALSDTLSVSGATSLASLSAGSTSLGALSAGATTLSELTVSGAATSTFGGSVNIDSGCFAVAGTCLGGGTGTLTAINGLTAASQTFATSSDTNIGLAITSSGSTHTFAPTWSGVLSLARGGTGTSTAPSYGQLLLGNAGGTYDLVATSSLGIASSQWTTSGADIYYNSGDVAIGTTTAPEKLTVNGNIKIVGSNGGFRFGTGGNDATIFNFDAPDVTNQAAIIRFFRNTTTSGSRTVTYYKDGSGTAGIHFDLNGNNSYFNTGGNIGIGTTSPYAKLSVVGEVVASHFTATSTSATSIFSGNVQIGSTPSYSQTRRFKIYDDGVDGNARISLVGTSGWNNGPAIEFVADGSISSRALIRFEEESGIGYGLSFWGTQSTTVAEKMRLSGNGNLGIGTTSPYAKLSVVGEVVASHFTATSTSATSTFMGRVGIGVEPTTAYSLSFAAVNGAKVNFYNGLNYGIGMGANLLQIFAPSGSARVGIGLGSSSSFTETLSVSTNVGIGTTSPMSKLTVDGTDLLFLRSSGDSAVLRIADTAHAGFYLTHSESNPLASQNSAFGMLASASEAQLTQFVGDSVGNAFTFTNIANRVKDHDHALQTNPTIFIHSDTDPDTDNTQWLSLAHDQTNGVIATGKGALVLSPTTNVGIGTTSPYAKLSVAGEVVASHYTGTTTATSTFASSLIVNNGGYKAMLGGLENSPGGFAGLWLGTSQASATNYAFLGTSGQTFFNTANTGTADIEFRVGNVTKFAVGNNGAGVFLGGNVAPTHPFEVKTTSGGTTAFLINSSGNVGVGTTSPLASLHVNNISGTSGFIFEKNSTQAFLDVIPFSSTAMFADINNATGNTFRFRSKPYTSLGANSGVTQTILTLAGDTGNVGVGTTSPFMKLAVDATTGDGIFVRNSSAAGYGFELGFPSNASGQPTISAYVTGIPIGSGRIFQRQVTTNDVFVGDIDDNNGSIRFRAGGSTDMSLINGGNLGIGTTTPYAKLSVTNTGSGPSFVVEDTSSPDSSPFIIDSSGNVGIGEASPDEKLSVVGTDIITLNVESNNITSTAFAVNNTAQNQQFEFGVTGTSNSYGNGSFLIWNRTAGNGPMLITSSGNTRIGHVSNNGTVGSKLSVAGNLSVGSTYYATAAPTDGVIVEGNVGIGTTTPTSKLSVTGDAYIDGDVYASSTNPILTINSASGGSSTLRLDNNVHGPWDLETSGSSLRLVDSFSNTQVTFARAGNTTFSRTAIFNSSVGIGTTSPATTLSVSGNGYLTGGLGVGTVNTTAGSIQTTGDLTVGVQGGGNRTITINSSNGSGKRAFLSHDGSGLTIGYSIANQYLNLGSSSSGWVNGIFYYGGKHIFDGGGNVGIGTTTPYAKLSVVGQAVAEYFTATSTSIASNFYGGINLRGANFNMNDGGGSGGGTLRMDGGSVEMESGYILSVGAGGSWTSFGLNTMTDLSLGTGYNFKMNDGGGSGGGTLYMDGGSITGAAEITSSGTVTAGYFSGDAGSLTGTATGLNIGGQASYASSAAEATYAFALSGQAASYLYGNSLYMGSGAGSGGGPLYMEGGTLYLGGGGGSGGGTLSIEGGAIVQSGTISPNGDNLYDLGELGNAWANLYYYTLNQASDRNKKDAITALDSELGLDFIKKLRPVSYAWKTAPDRGTNLGFIAQDVEGILDVNMMLSLVSKDENGENYTMDYTQLIAPMVKAIQQVDIRLATIEDSLKGNTGIAASVSDWIGEKVQAVTGVFERLFVKRIRVEDGIEMKAEDGKIWCVRIDGNGDWKKALGSCDEVVADEEYAVPTEPPVDEPVDEPEVSLPEEPVEESPEETPGEEAPEAPVQEPIDSELIDGEQPEEGVSEKPVPITEEGVAPEPTAGEVSVHEIVS